MCYAGSTTKFNSIVPQLAMDEVLYQNGGEYSSIVNFLALARRIETVVRILNPLNVSLEGHGTGFLIAEGLILTNYHVLPSKKMCRKSKAEFSYDENNQSFSLDLDPDSFFYKSPVPNPKDIRDITLPLNPECLDFTIVALKPITDLSLIQKLGRILKSYFNLVEIDSPVGKHANIIQHPDDKGNSYKKIAFRDNEILDYKDSFLLHYKTKTLPGSSGSPVMDDLGRLIGLHRSECPERKVEKHKKTHKRCHTAISINQIIAHLKRSYRKKVKNKTVFEEILGWVYETKAFLAFKESVYSQTVSRQIQEADVLLKKLDVSATHEDCEEIFKLVKTSKEALKRATDNTPDLEIKREIELQTEVLEWRWRVYRLHLAINAFRPGPAEYKFFEVYKTLNDLSYSRERINSLLESNIETIRREGKDEANFSLDDHLSLAIQLEIMDATDQAIAAYYALARYYKRIQKPKYRANALKSAWVLEKRNPKIRKGKAKLIQSCFDFILKKMKLEKEAEVACSILHDKHDKTTEWVDEYLLPDLNSVGIKITPKPSSEDWHLVICSNGSLQGFMDSLSQKGASKNVIYIKRASNAIAEGNCFDCCKDKNALYHSEINYFKNIINAFCLILRCAPRKYIQMFKTVLTQIESNALSDLELLNYNNFIENEKKSPLSKKQRPRKLEPSPQSTVDTLKIANVELAQSYIQDAKNKLMAAQNESDENSALKLLKEAKELCLIAHKFEQSNNEIPSLQKQIMELRYDKQLQQDKRKYLEENFDKGFFFDNFENGLKKMNLEGLKAIFTTVQSYIKDKRPKKGDYFVCSFIARILGNKEASAEYFDKLGRLHQQEKKSDFAEACFRKSEKLTCKSSQLRYEFEQQIKAIAQQSPQEKGPRCYLCYGHSANCSPEFLVKVQRWIWDLFLPDLDLTGSSILYDQREQSRRSQTSFVNEMDDCDFILLICSTELARNGNASEIKKLKKNSKKVLLIIYEKEFEDTDLNLSFDDNFRYDFTKKDYFDAFFKLCTRLRGNELAPTSYTRQFLENINKPISDEYAKQIVDWSKKKKIEKHTQYSILNSPQTHKKN